MENPVSLLSSVRCGSCGSHLIQRIEEGSLVKYKCSCTLKIRTILSCNYCKKEFLILPYLIRKTNYCSLKCYWIATDRKQQRICRLCNRKFYADNALIQKGFGFYCSRDCWFSLFRQARQNIKCIQCGRERSIFPALLKKNPKYCSKKCSDDFRRDYVSKVCKNCKKRFELPRTDLNRGRGLFCSRKCYKHFDGETSIERLIRLELQKLKEPFEQEWKIGRYYADFYLPERDLIIECDGEYWHSSQTVKLRDKRKDKFLRKQGYKIMRLTEGSINKHEFGSIYEFLGT